jgi:hypothetical protein
MPNTFRLLRGAAICTYDLTGRQVYMRLSGPLTPALMQPLAADLRRVCDRVLAKSFVVDLRASVLAIPYEDLIRETQYQDPILRALPRAIVPSPNSVELFRDYAWAVAKMGLLCGVFRERVPAQLWAAAKGETRLYSRTPVSAR